ncbi:MAG: LysR family transcriptional regulator [Hyphomicrobiales bacterium]
MDISLRHVEVFHAIMTTGGVTQAAALLRTSQPTISRELQRFERLLGFTLFERKTRRLVATEQAVLLHAEVRRSFSGLQQLVRTSQAIRSNLTSHIQIACLPLFSQTLMPQICTRFFEHEKTAKLTFHSLDQSLLLKELLNLRYEFGLMETGVAVQGTSIREIPIGDEVCILPTGHPLCARKIVEPRDFEGECFVSLAQDDVYRQRYDKIFDEAGVSRRMPVETTTAEAVCALVRRGLGVSIVNPISARAHLGQGLEIRPFSISIPFVIGIFRPMSRKLSKLGERLAEYMMEECRNVQAELGTVIS